MFFTTKKEMLRKVLVTMGDRTVEARVILSSKDRESLLLGFDGMMRTRDGAYWISNMPVLFFPASDRWEDLRGEEVKLEWI